MMSKRSREALYSKRSPAGRIYPRIKCRLGERIADHKTFVRVQLGGQAEGARLSPFGAIPGLFCPLKLIFFSVHRFSLSRCSGSNLSF